MVLIKNMNQCFPVESIGWSDLYKKKWESNKWTDFYDISFSNRVESLQYILSAESGFFKIFIYLIHKILDIVLIGKTEIKYDQVNGNQESEVKTKKLDKNFCPVYPLLNLEENHWQSVAYKKYNWNDGIVQTEMSKWSPDESKKIKPVAVQYIIRNIECHCEARERQTENGKTYKSVFSIVLGFEEKGRYTESVTHTSGRNGKKHQPEKEENLIFSEIQNKQLYGKRVKNQVPELRFFQTRFSQISLYN